MKRRVIHVSPSLYADIERQSVSCAGLSTQEGLRTIRKESDRWRMDISSSGQRTKADPSPDQPPGVGLATCSPADHTTLRCDFLVNRLHAGREILPGMRRSSTTPRKNCYSADVVC